MSTRRCWLDSEFEEIVLRTCEILDSAVVQVDNVPTGASHRQCPCRPWLDPFLGKCTAPDDSAPEPVRQRVWPFLNNVITVTPVMSVKSVSAAGRCPPTSTTV